MQGSGNARKDRWVMSEVRWTSSDGSGASSRLITPQLDLVSDESSGIKASALSGSFFDNRSALALLMACLWSLELIIGVSECKNRRTTG